MSEVLELVNSRMGPATRFSASLSHCPVFASQAPTLIPSPITARQVTVSPEDGTDAVGLHLMMETSQVFLSANDHSLKISLHSLLRSKLTLWMG